MVFPILESFELLTCAVRAFQEKCVSGISVNVEANQAHIHTIIPRLTALVEKHGYSQVNAVCKEAGGDLALLKVRLGEVFGE